MDKVGKFLAVASAAAWIRVENDVTSRSEHLFFEVEAVAIVSKRATVNLQDKRIFLGSVEIRRVDDPALDFAVVF